MDTINTPTLSDHITHVSSLPLHARIQALHTLTPQLTPSISPTGTRLITHPSYSGYAHLDPLGTLYISTATACFNEHAPLQTRLLHADLDPIFESIYVSSEEKLAAGLKDGTVTIPKKDNGPVGCACCRGGPDAVILAGFEVEEALYFYEDEYRAMWGDEPENGMTYSSSEGTRLAASREQIERVLAREREGTGKVAAVL
ncbi:hypothetical protein BO78DRAFT_134798 [Aspergillus sclerotiicarbonarius CBS 121057]|uniref:Uncharacterized protein n=1 Tax=Aspergillus sclerotiicarbonarius (strain CBS 121057 / IBT 28362) TaxID=1448318 RepID=A0A319EMH2_ASPSB|nr:hypothetical protein BO78DRAFT_134798 [Aspergillus sclerotiicarbonarius CBS 121057]